MALLQSLVSHTLYINISAGPIAGSSSIHLPPWGYARVCVCVSVWSGWRWCLQGISGSSLTSTPHRSLPDPLDHNRVSGREKGEEEKYNQVSLGTTEQNHTSQRGNITSLCSLKVECPADWYMSMSAVKHCNAWWYWHSIYWTLMTFSIFSTFEPITAHPHLLSRSIRISLPCTPCSWDMTVVFNRAIMS